MDIKKQVLSVEQMQHLKHLGLDTSDATMCWIKTPKGREVAFNEDWTGRRESFLEPIPAYTLQDLLYKLPFKIETYWLDFGPNSPDKEDVEWYMKYDQIDPGRYLKYLTSINLIDAAYEMLCWCVEKGHIKTGKEETK